MFFIIIFSYRKDNNKKHLKEKKFIKSALSKHKRNNFIFLEDFHNIKELINISDIIVYPTLDMNEKQEIPMILLESLAMEKPIIITDIPPLNEILKSNCGIKIGKNGRKMVVKYFNIIKIAREYEKFYSSI